MIFLTQSPDLSDNSLSGFLPSDLRFPPLEILDVANNRLEGFIPPMLCLTGDINGNGMNGDFNCDVVACSPGTWSPIGRASPRGMHSEDGKPIYECRPCHNERSGLIGSKVCGGVHVVLGDHKSVTDIIEGGGDIMVTIATLCAAVGILAAFIVYRTMKTRMRALDQTAPLAFSDRERGGGGSDTDSYFTDATDTNSVCLTKLDPFDEQSMYTENDEFVDISVSSGSNGLELSPVDEESDEDSSNGIRGENSSQRICQVARPRSVELWLDVPSI